MKFAPMKFFKLLPIYFRALKPSALRAYMQRERAKAFQQGYESGFDKGHLRGWCELRSKLRDGEQRKHPHEPASVRS